MTFYKFLHDISSDYWQVVRKDCLLFKINTINEWLSIMIFVHFYVAYTFWEKS